MREYLQLLDEVLHHGTDRNDRTGVGTRSLFGRQMRFNLDDGFPLLTTKKVHLRSIIYELLWFLRGDTNTAWLTENGVSIWDEWADKDGNLGPVYGKQWRSWETASGQTIDQIAWVENEIRTNPNSRRLIVSAWNVADVNQMALPPCHLLFQFYVAGDRLSCQMYQRSGDIFLGIPFNIASYALLTMMMAKVTGLRPGEFVHTSGDLHLYRNHFDQAREQLSRHPRPRPRMELADRSSIDQFQYEDFRLIDYDPPPADQGSGSSMNPADHRDFDNCTAGAMVESDRRPAIVLTAVVAMTPSGVIGNDGQLPWRISSDLRRFKQATMGGVLIMGRKTYDSIGRPLPGRDTIVISRNPDWVAAGIWRVDSPAAAIDLLGDRPGFVVGGAQIYQSLLGRCQRVLLTRVLAEIDGDTVLDLDLSDFRLVQKAEFPATERDQYPTEFLELVR